MEIQIDRHTLERAQERGTDEVEIRDVILTGLTIKSKCQLPRPYGRGLYREIQRKS